MKPTPKANSEEKQTPLSRYAIPKGPDCEDTAGLSNREAKPITIIRDDGPDASAPNLSLNCHDRVGRGEIYLAAALGIVLQISALIFSSLITYYQNIRSSFKKEDKFADGYAFPCAAIGTLCLAVGLFLCAAVVEQSTDETCYTTTDEGTKIWVVWLQKSHITNDQVFKPFAIYPGNYRQFFMTSRRKSRSRKQGPHESSSDEETPNRILEIMAITGTVVSLVGFGVQFVGLRGLHWSSSIAQLGAIIIMTIARAWVRRGLAQPPISSSVTPDFELDWFALSLTKPATASWRSDKKDEGHAKGKKELPNDWAVCSGQSKDYKKFAPLEKVTDPNVSQESLPGKFSSARSNAQRVVRVRKQLGDLANWKGPASEEAVRLSEAIEVVAKALLPHSRDKFTWSLHINQGSEQTEPQIVCLLIEWREGGWKVDAGTIEAAMSLWMHSIRTHEDTTINTGSAQDTKSGIERLRSQAGRESGLRLYGSCELRNRIERDLQWWMPEATTDIFAFQSVPNYIEHHGISKRRVVGFAGSVATNGQAPVKQNTHSSGAMPDSSQSVYSGTETGCRACEATTSLLEKSDSDMPDDLESEKHDGGNDDKTQGVRFEAKAPAHTGTLAIPCNDPLEKLLSRDLMLSFIMAVAQLPEVYTQKAAARGSVDNYSFLNDPKDLKLHNEQITNLVRDLEKTGYGNPSEIWVDIILPLSIRNKMTDLTTVVQTARERAREHELNRDWENLVQICSWLLDVSAKLDPDRDCAQPLAVSICLDILRRMDNAVKLVKFEMKADDLQLSNSRDLLVEMFCRQRLSNSIHFFRLIEARREDWDEELLRKVLQIPSVSIDEARLEDFPESFKITSIHRVAMGGEGDEFNAETVPNNLEVNAFDEDSLGWTFYHYLMARKIPVPETTIFGFRLSSSRRIPQSVDFRGWTILHYACQNADVLMVDHLLENKAAIAASGNDGVTPIHCAIQNPSRKIIDLFTAESRPRLKYVCESQGGPKMRDCNGRSPAHWAAIEGSIDWAEVVKYDVHLKDKFGLTALHLAVIYGQAELLRFLVNKFGSGKDDLSGGQYSSQRYSPLHYALVHQKDDMVQILVDAGADIQLPSIDGETPLHLADTKRSVELLVEKGANLEAQDDRGHTPLQHAVLHKQEAVSWLLEAGAEVDATDRNGFTPLYGAIIWGHKSVVPVLLAKGADITFLSPHDALNAGRSPLQLAVSQGHLDIVEALSDHDREAFKKAVLIQNNAGDNPLHTAAYRSKLRDGAIDTSVSILRKLLSISPDTGINVRNQYGETPLGIALKRGNQEFIEVLRQSGAKMSEPEGE